MAWDPKLAKRIYIGCTSKACVKKNLPAWHYWLKYTKSLREAGKPLLWRARVDLLGDGRHETLILLTHNFPLDVVRGKIVPAPPRHPYCRYIDSVIYMLPKPHPRMAEAFNNGPMSGWGWLSRTSSRMSVIRDSCICRWPGRDPFRAVASVYLPSNPAPTSTTINFIRYATSAAYRAGNKRHDVPYLASWNSLRILYNVIWGLLTPIGLP